MQNEGFRDPDRDRRANARHLRPDGLSGYPVLGKDAERSLRYLIGLPGPAWRLIDLGRDKKAPATLADDLAELVDRGYAMRFDHPDGEHVVLTELAAGKMRRVPDITGGFRDSEVSRRPVLGQSNPASGLDYLQDLISDGRAAGLFRGATRMALDANPDFPWGGRGAAKPSRSPKSKKTKAGRRAIAAGS